MSNVTWTTVNGHPATTPVSRTFISAESGEVFVMHGSRWSKDMRAVEPAELTAMEAQIDGLTGAITAIQGE